MEEKICSFFGHREIIVTEELCATLTAEIEKTVDFGCRTFYFGGFGEFDALCYKIVTEIKEKNAFLNLNRVYCVPIEKQLRKRVRYFDPAGYEDIIFLEPSFGGWYKSIYYRNLAMIDISEYIIFYAEERKTSGAYKAFKYAKRKKKRVVNLFDYN